MDVLADILSSLRLTGGVVIDAETQRRFLRAVAVHATTISSAFQFVPDELITYHYVRSGKLFASVDGEPPVAAEGRRHHPAPAERSSSALQHVRVLRPVDPRPDRAGTATALRGSSSITAATNRKSGAASSASRPSTIRSSTPSVHP